MRIAIDIRRVHEFGIGTHIWNLVRNIARFDLDNQYCLIGSRRNFLELGSLPDRFSLIEVPEDNGFWNLQIRIPLRLRSHRIDVFHVPHYRAPLWVPCRLVVTVHDCVHLLFPPEGSSKFDNYRRYVYTRRVLGRADRVISVSASTRKDLENIFDLPGEKVRVVHNALDGRFTAPHDPEQQKAVLERYQLKDPFVLYAGVIKPHKNLDRLIEAFAVLKNELADSKKFRNLKLIIIGDEVTRNQYLRLTAVRSGVQQDVRFFGVVGGHTLQVFYETAVLFAQPSLYEGFGLPPLEAMANGTPVVASNTSSLPEVLGDAALLVRPEHVFDIARAMKQLLIDQVLRQDAIEKGKVQAAKFSWEKSAREVVETYRDVWRKGTVPAAAEIAP